MSQHLPRLVLWSLLCIPASLILFQFMQDTSMAEQLLHPTGEFSARFLIIAMIATPLRLLFKTHRWPIWLVRNRRYFYQFLI